MYEEEKARRKAERRRANFNRPNPLTALDKLSFETLSNYDLDDLKERIPITYYMQ